MNSIIIVGLSDFPFKKRASDSRILAFCDLNYSVGYNTIVSNRFSTSDQEVSNFSFKVVGQSISAPFFLKFILGLIREFFFISKASKNGKIILIQLYSNHFFDVVWYSIIARLINVKLVLHYVEMRSSWNNKNIYHIINSYLFDRFSSYFISGVISISSVIKESVLKNTKNIECIVIPSISNPSMFDTAELINTSYEYLFYVGSIGHIASIIKITDAYNQSNLINKLALVLVVNGPAKKIEEFRLKFENNRIRILTDLSFEVLFGYMKSAKFALIPLNSNEQDAARFPNKISEYAACGLPIITTEVGDISRYFSKNINVIYTRDFSVESLKKTFNDLEYIDHDSYLNIKNETYKVYLNCFDINVYKQQYKTFIEVLV